MFFPEFLLKLSQRDEQVTWLDPVVQRVRVSAAAAQVFATFTVPEGRALALTHVGAGGTPGAAQNLTNLRAYVARPNTGVPIILANGIFNSAVFDFISWQGQVLLPPGLIVELQADFSAGVAANIAVLDLIGVIIPVGNIQRV